MTLQTLKYLIIPMITVFFLTVFTVVIHYGLAEKLEGNNWKVSYSTLSDIQGPDNDRAAATS